MRAGMSPIKTALVLFFLSGCTPGETSNDSSAQSVQCPAKIGDWSAGVSYAAGALVQYHGAVYRCIQPHTALDNWTPDAVPALWEPVQCSGTTTPSVPPTMPSTPPSCSTPP